MQSSISQTAKKAKKKTRIASFWMSAYMIRASVLCSDWSLQLVSIGYGRAHQSEFLLIVSREVKGEESALPNNSGEVCPTNFCPRAGHCMVPKLSIHNLLNVVSPQQQTHRCRIYWFLLFSWTIFICRVLLTSKAKNVTPSSVCGFIFWFFIIFFNCFYTSLASFLCFAWILPFCCFRDNPAMFRSI